MYILLGGTIKTNKDEIVIRSSNRSHQAKDIEDIIFHISKKIENKQIIKTIEFSADDQKYKFREEVSLLRKEDFISFAKRQELELLNEFGNYQLEPFHDQSERLILIFKKK